MLTARHPAADRSLSRAGLWAVAGMVLAAPALGQSIDLGYAWPQGLELRYRVRNEIQQETSSPYVNAGSQVTTSSTITMKVVSERRGTGTVEVTTQALAVNVDMGNLGEVRFDSENARDRRRVNDPDVEPFTFLLGKTYTMTMAPTGEVQRLEGYDEHLQRMLRRVRDDAMRTTLEAGLNQGLIRAQLEQTWHVVPDQPVRVGQSWPVRITQDVPNVGQVIIELRYTLRELDQDQGMQVAIIDAAGQVRLGRTVPGIRATITDSTIEGELVFAPELGLLLESDLTQSMVFDLRGPGGAVHLTMDSSTQIELLNVGGLEAAAAPPSAPAPRRVADPGQRDKR